MRQKNADKKSNKKREVMLARRKELWLQVKQLEMDKANECAPIEAKYQEAMTESYKRRDEDPRRVDQKVW